MIEICAGSKCIEIGKDLFEEALRIKREAEKRGDLTTRWWKRFMIALFTGVVVSGYSTFSFVDTGGVSRTQSVKYPLGTQSLLFNTGGCNNRFWISVGIMSTPSSIDQTGLLNKIAEAITSLSYDESQGIILLSVGFQFSSDTTIYEVGLEWEATLSSYNVCGRFLIDRTVIPDGFTAPANTPITVTYRILV
jgi:hypothetical protein